MQEILQNIDKTKSIAEHILIILKYQQTGLFDRAKALEVYKSFNLIHSDYNILMNETAAATNSRIQIDSATDEIIVENLKRQAVWSVGADYLKNIGIFL
jgi:hypothetical protein